MLHLQVILSLLFSSIPRRHPLINARVQHRLRDYRLLRLVETTLSDMVRGAGGGPRVV